MAALTWLDGPHWPGVAIRFTTRHGGVSAAPFDSMNLGTHVGDDAGAVAENRRRVSAHLPARALWLDQVHGTRVLDADQLAGPCDVPPQADAAFTTRRDQVLAIMVADCLPIAISDGQGTIVAAVHAGWRGLADGVIEATLAQLKQARPDQQQWRAWIGPAIGPRAFEVGADVVHAFLKADAQAHSCFVPRPGMHDKWLADLPALAARRLQGCGVTDVSLADRCTASEPDTFFSYRRDGVCGRMVLLAWLEEDPN